MENQENQENNNKDEQQEQHEQSQPVTVDDNDNDNNNENNNNNSNNNNDNEYGIENTESVSSSSSKTEEHIINTNVSQEELEKEIKKEEEIINVTDVNETEITSVSVTTAPPTATTASTTPTAPPTTTTIETTPIKVPEVPSPVIPCNKNGLCRHKDHCVVSTLKTLLRGFAIGYGLRAGIALVTGLLLRKLYRNPRKLINQSLLHKDPIGFGLFLGCYTGGFKGINCLLRAIRGKEDGLNSLIAGFIAGSSMMFSKSTEMALYLFARALESLFNAAVKRGYLKSYTHGDTVIFCICTTILFHGFVWEPTTVRASYLKFLSKVAGKNRDIGKITSVIRDMYYKQYK